MFLWSLHMYSDVSTHHIHTDNHAHIPHRLIQHKHSIHTHTNTKHTQTTYTPLLAKPHTQVHKQTWRFFFLFNYFIKSNFIWFTHLTLPLLSGISVPNMHASIFCVASPHAAGTAGQNEHFHSSKKFSTLGYTLILSTLKYVFCYLLVSIIKSSS